MTRKQTHLPLAGTALELLGEGSTASELEGRFARAGASVMPGVAVELLHDLLALGLVRVARRDADGPTYVPTTLGAKAIADGIGGIAAVALTDLETLRTDLLSTIAHELRTPLTAVRTSVGLLTDETSTPTDEQRRMLLDNITRNAERMQRLIADILDITRFRAGHVRLQLRRFDAGTMARNVAASLSTLAGLRAQSLVVEAPEAGPLVYGDHRRLEQALVNLVSNALRFSPDGATIVIEVEADGDLVRWRVIDSGPGISIEDQARLFERFFVGRGDRHGSREGVGLGLPTALAIAQAHGGTIEVESEVGAGSRFGLAVPADGPAETD